VATPVSMVDSSDSPPRGLRVRPNRAVRIPLPNVRAYLPTSHRLVAMVVLARPIDELGKDPTELERLSVDEPGDTDVFGKP